MCQIIVILLVVDITSLCDSIVPVIVVSWFAIIGRRENFTCQSGIYTTPEHAPY